MNTSVKDDSDEFIRSFISGYRHIVVAGFDERWSMVDQEIYNKYVSETIGALLSRQATLSIEMICAPTTWNAHVSHLFLRCMVEVHITLAWIFSKPEERSKKYVEYGLGQEKLLVEYLEEEISKFPDSDYSETVREMITNKRAWINSQLAEWATEVNVGSWSGMSIRDMAKECKQEALYRHAYVPLSGATHNMWQHVSVHNAEPCSNPLHKWHIVPRIISAPSQLELAHLSARYLSDTFDLFDKHMNINCDIPLPELYFSQHELFSDETAS